MGEFEWNGDFTIQRQNMMTGQMETVPLFLKAEHPTANTPETGMRVWDAGITFAKWAEAHQQEINGKRVLELGCGTAISGLAMALLGAQVVVTDLEVLRQSTGQSIAMNQSAIAQGGGSCRFEALDWNNIPPNVGQLLGPEPFDFIIASDVIWNKVFIEPYLRTCNQLKNHAGGHPRIIMAHKVREKNLEDEFSQALGKFGFGVHEKTHASQFIPEDGLLQEKCEVTEFAY